MPSFFVQPFDFKTVLMQLLLGSPSLFIFAYAIGMSIIAAYFNMSPMVFGVVLVVNVIIFAAFLGNSILLLVGVILALVVYSVLKKVMQF